MEHGARWSASLENVGFEGDFCFSWLVFDDASIEVVQ